MMIKIYTSPGEKANNFKEYAKLTMILLNCSAKVLISKAFFLFFFFDIYHPVPYGQVIKAPFSRTETI